MHLSNLDSNSLADEYDGLLDVLAQGLGLLGGGLHRIFDECTAAFGCCSNTRRYLERSEIDRRQRRHGRQRERRELGQLDLRDLDLRDLDLRHVERQRRHGGRSSIRCGGGNLRCRGLCAGGHRGRGGRRLLAGLARCLLSDLLLRGRGAGGCLLRCGVFGHDASLFSGTAGSSACSLLCDFPAEEFSAWNAA